MSSVEKVNLSNSNQIRFTAQLDSNSEVKESYVKKYFTAPNLILGSLATVGVLGMADVLICKGKHLNKITGKGKELEEALSRATTAETKLQSVETKLQEVESELSALKTKFSLPSNTTAKGDRNIFLEGIQLFYHDAQALNGKCKQRFCEIINDVLEQLGCKIVEPPKDIKLAKDFYIEYVDKINEVRMAKPAILDIETNECILPGRAFYPKSMMPN